MQILTIRNFACLQEVVLEIRPVTVLVGPQASGKSIISKLLYFFNDLVNFQYESAENRNSIEKFGKLVAAKFEEWFPASAWGNKGFEITFKSGDLLSYSIKRKASARKVYDEIEIVFSDFFVNQYKEILKQYSNRAKRKSAEDDFIMGSSFENIWRVRSASYKYLQQSLKSDFVASQIFIPAGRSFFTNLGKAVAMLEHGNQLDEITRGFGRLFTNLIDGHRMYYASEKANLKEKEFLAYQKEKLEELFGGTVRVTANDRHLDSKDGRKIPFSILSSGQQELLPLLLILQHEVRNLIYNREKNTTDLIYVEEPEAHLFPSAQGALVEYIASISAFLSKSCNIVLTTHSPYVIAKLNNLIKAFTVSKLADESVARNVESIVDRRCWLPPSSVNAYALDGGILKSVKDESGLIDGGYLDSISEDIGERFMQLLEAETEYGRRQMLITQRAIQNKVGGGGEVGNIS